MRHAGTFRILDADATSPNGAASFPSLILASLNTHYMNFLGVRLFRRAFRSGARARAMIAELLISSIGVDPIITVDVSRIEGD